MYHRLPVPGDDAAMAGFRQQVAAANAGDAERGLFSNLLAEIGAAERHRLSQSLEHLPEDVCGQLHRPIAINLRGYMDALGKSQ